MDEYKCRNVAYNWIHEKSVSFYCFLMNTSIDSNYFAMVIESHNNIYHRAVHKCRREAKIESLLIKLKKGKHNTSYLDTKLYSSI